MIKRKPSEPFQMVLTHDPALLPAENEGAIQRYEIDRDLSHFDLDLDRGIYKPTGEKVTLVKAYPLRSEAFAWLDAGSVVFRKIVKTHVVGVKNFDGVKVVESRDGKFEMTEESLDNIDLDTLTEIATVIIDKGRGRDGEDRAFFSGDTFSRTRRIRSLQLPANAARIESAKNIESLTDSGVEETPAE